MSSSSSQRKVFVVSAPSGTGKTTLNRRLLQENDNLEMSVSYTARSPREGEQDGIDYHFVDDGYFRELISTGQMLEHAEVFGKLYGTSLKEVERIHGLGKDVLLEIDTQGFLQAKSKLPDAISVFVLPPTVVSLWQRLESRGTEPEEVRLRRLMTARDEISCGQEYDWFIINDDVEKAYSELQRIVIKGESGSIDNRQGTAMCLKLLEEFGSSPLIQKLSAKIADKKSGR